jgi:molybdopterin-guanine dinucleotide biosynthesis protein A
MEADSARSGAALGAVLAGGRGSRLGGAKAWAELGGRPLYSYPLAAIEAAGLEPVVCVKQSESRGSFPTHTVQKEPRNEVAVIEEPDEPRHPLCGIVAALRAGEGLRGKGAPRPVIAVACDMPFVAPELLAFLADADDPLVVPAADGRLHPLLGRYAPALLPELEAALEGEEPLTRTVESLGPRLLGEEELARFGDPPRLIFNVNDPEDLREAESLLTP